jgi:hypothetical protein
MREDYWLRLVALSRFVFGGRQMLMSVIRGSVGIREDRARGRHGCSCAALFVLA